ncbi:MAG: LamG-like jellyroll fold domain-containing protein, partial [Candidatus Micrarchaeia archaeon]
SYGIYLSSSSNYNTIANSNGTSNSQPGIYLNSASNNTITSSTGTSNSSQGIVLASNSNNTITSSTGTSNSSNGILLSSSSNNTITSSTGTSNTSVGIYFAGASNNTITNSAGTSTSNVGILLSASSNYNTISNSTGTSNSNYGIYLSSSSNNAITNSVARNLVSGATGYGLYITSGAHNTQVINTTVSSNLSSAIYIDGGSNVSIDCQGKSIVGTNTSATYGIYSDEFNTTVKNCNISNFATGIYFNGATNGMIQNTNTSTTKTASGTDGYAIYLLQSNNITAMGSIANALDGIGIYVSSTNNSIISGITATIAGTTSDYRNPIILYLTRNNIIANNTLSNTGTMHSIGVLSSSNNTVINNTFSSRGSQAYIDSGASGNTFCLNNFTSIGNPTTYVQDLNGSNYYNCTYATKNQGNMYANVMNGSIQVLGTTVSSFPSLYIGSAGAGFPYNNSSSGGKFVCSFAGCADFAPLTPVFLLLSTPSSLAVSSVTDQPLNSQLGEMSLSWGANSNPAGTVYEVNETISGQTVSSSTALNFTHTGLLDNTQYCYKVRATLGGQYSNYTSAICNITFDRTAPATPNLLPGKRGLVAYYKLDDGSGTSAADSAYNNTGAVSGATWTSGRVNGGLSFNAVDNYAYATVPGILTDPTISYTLESWVSPRVNTNSSEHMVVGKVGRHGGILSTSSSGSTIQFRFQYVNNASGWFSIISSAVPLDSWHHVVATYNATNKEMKLYVDNVLAGSANFTGTPTSYGSTLYLGGYSGATSKYGFNGSIDEVKIYNRALTATEVEEDYNNSVAYVSFTEGDNGLQLYMPFEEGAGATTADWSPNANDGTITGATWTSGKFGNAMSFDGSDYITAPNSSIPVGNAITASFWAYGADALPANTAAITSSNAGGYVINVHLPWSNGFVYWDCGNNGAAYDRIYKAANASDYKGRWTYWTFTKDASTGEMKIYIDGVLWHSETGKTMPIPAATYLRIGQAYQGKIDELRIYNRSLSQHEIITDMQSGLISKGLYRSNTTTGIYTPVNGTFEDFSSGSDSAWVKNGGTWNVSGGSYISPTSGEVVSVTGDPALADYVVESDFEIVSGNHASLIFRSPNINQFYQYEIYGGTNSLNGGNINLYKYNSGYSNLAVTDIADLSYNTWYHAKAIVSGNVIKLYLNDVLLMTYADSSSPYLAGKAGVGTHSAASIFDNFKVTPFISSPNYTDNGARDVSVPMTPAQPTLARTSTSTLNLTWLPVDDTGSTYYYYANAVDSNGNEEDLLYDGGFEKVSLHGYWLNASLIQDGASFDSNTTYSGAYSLKQTATNGTSCGNWADCNRYWGSNFGIGTDVAPNSLYQLSCMAKTQLSTGFATLYLEQNGTRLYYDNLNGTADWRPIREVFRTGTTGTVRLLAYTIGGTGTVNWDGCELHMIKNLTLLSGTRDYWINGTNANVWYAGTSVTISNLASHTWYCYAVAPRDIAGNLGGYSVPVCNMTMNNPPNMTSVTLVPSIAYTSDQLNASATATDTNNDTLTYTYNWYLNGAPYASLLMPFDNNVSVNDTGAIQDYSGNGNNGTLGAGNASRMPTWTTAGKIGGAYAFDGASSYISAPISSVPQVFTITAWIKLNQLGREQHFAEFTGTQFYVSSGNKLGTSAWSNAVGTTSLTTGTWYFATLVRNTTNVSLYLNGVYEGAGSLGANATSPFSIGDYYAHSGNYKFTGTIDQVAIYPRALSAQEIAAQYALNYNVMMPDELEGGQSWKVEATASDGFDSSAPMNSSTSTVKAGCGVLKVANRVVTLVENLSSSGTCFNVTAQNVTINCNGYSITGTNTTNTSGIYSNQFNTTIKNCNIRSFGAGIYFSGATNGTIINDTVSETLAYSAPNGMGIYLDSGSNYNTITNTVSSAIRPLFVRLSHHNAVTNVTATSVTDLGIYFDNSQYNTVTNSTAITGSGYGIRFSLNAHNNNLVGTTASSNTSSAIYINGGSNITIDCQGKSIIGTNVSNTYGVYSTEFNTTVKNCNISNFDVGIYFNSADNGTMENNTVNVGRNNYVVPLYSSAIAVYNASNYNMLRNNTVYSAYGVGIIISTSSTGNTIINANATAVSRGAISFDNGVTSNSIINSTGTSVSGVGLGSWYSSNNNVSGSTFSSGSSYGIYLLYNSNGNIFTNSTAKSDSNNSIRVETTSNNNQFIGTTTVTGTNAASTAYNIIGGSNVSIDCQSDNIDDPSLKLYMPFEEGSGTVARDWSTYGNDGALTSGTWASGKYGGALSFNGNNTAVSVGAPASLEATGGVTLSAWIYPLPRNFTNKYFGLMAPIISKGTWSTVNYELQLSEANQVSFVHRNNGNLIYENFNLPSSILNGWHHVAASVCNSVACNNTVYFYLDGALIGGASVAEDGGVLPTAGQTFLVGGLGGYGFNGTIDEVRVYDRALSADEIANVMAGSRMLLGTNTSGTYGVYSNQLNTTVRNCAIRNFASGIYLSGADYGTIENVSAKTTRAGGYGVYLNGADYASIRNSNLSSANASALYSYLSNYGTVSGGIYGAASDGVGIYNATGNSISNLTISAGGYGIYLSPSSNRTAATSNMINSTSHGIFLDQGGNNNISFNAITRSDANNGIHLSSSVNNTISSNAITVATGKAIYIYYPDSTAGSNNVTSNIVTATGTGTGIALVNANTNSFSNNYASGGGYGISLGGSTNNSFIGDTGVASSGSAVGFFITNSPANRFANITGIASSGTAMRLQQASDNNVIENVTTTSTGSGTGIYVDGVSGTNITGMNLSAHGGDAIYLSSLAVNALLQNGSVSSNDGNGMTVSDGATGTIIANVSAYSGQKYGIFVKGSPSHTSIIGANASTASGAGIYLEATRANVSGSSGTSTGTGYGLRVHGGEMLDIADSNFTSAGTSGTGASALFEAASINNVVRGNTFSSSSSAGDLLVVSESSGNTFYWNTFGATTGYYAKDDDGQSNRYNASIGGKGEGNSWYNVIAKEVSICGALRSNKSDWASYYVGADSVADPKQYPYNEVNARGRLSGTIVDYAPMSTERCWLPQPIPQNYTAQGCALKSCNIDDDCMSGNAPYCDAGCNQLTHTCYPCVTCENAYCLPSGQPCGATRVLSGCGVATCNAGVCTSSGETCPGASGLACCPSSYCSDSGSASVCISKKLAGAPCASASECAPSAPYCTGTPAVCRACLPTGTYGCTSGSECCARADGAAGLCNLAQGTAGANTCVALLPVGGKTCLSSDDCVSGSNLTCKEGICAVNHPPSAPPAPVLGMSAANGTITCTQNCVSTNMPSDPDRDTPVKIEYRWVASDAPVTGFWHDSTTFNCELIPGGCQPNTAIKIQARACDKYRACSPAVSSQSINITALTGASCSRTSCSSASKCCSGFACKYDTALSTTGTCLISSPMLNCSNDANCLSGICRASAQNASVKVCVNELSAGQACNASQQCPAAYPYCANGVCTACIPVNSSASCASDSQCCVAGTTGAVSGVCSAGLCKACALQGAICTLDSYCCSGSCQESLGTNAGVCAPSRLARNPIGGACLNNSDCAVGLFCDTLNRGSRIGISAYGANRTIISDYGQCTNYYAPYTKCDITRAQSQRCYDEPSQFACTKLENSADYYCIRTGGTAGTQFNSWVKTGGIDFTPSTLYHSGTSSASVSGGVGSYAYNSALMGMLDGGQKYVVEFWAKASVVGTLARYALFDTINNAYLSGNGSWLYATSDTVPSGGIIEPVTSNAEWKQVVTAFKALPNAKIQFRFYPLPDGKTYNVDDLSVAKANDFSMLAWVRADASQPGGILFSQMSTHDGSPQGINWTVSTANVLSMGMYSSSSQVPNGPLSLSPNVSLADGKWHQVALSVDRTGDYSVYLDGALSQSAPFTLGGLESNGTFYIGSPGASGFSGELGEVRFYKRALTPADVMDHYNGWFQQQCTINLAFSYSGTAAQNLTAAYNADLRVRKLLPETVLAMPFDANISSDARGMIVDYSRFLGAGTKTGATWTPYGKVGGAYNFTGTTDKILLPSALITGAGDFTLSAWIYPVDGSPSVYYIMGNYAPNNLNGVEFFTYKGGQLGLYIQGYAKSAQSVPLNTWTHVAATRKGGVVRLYVNGVQSGSSTALNGSITSLKNFAIGNGPDYTSERFVGAIDEVRVFSRALTADEIASLYTDNALASSQALPLSQK